MSHLAIIDWDSQQLRTVVATVRRGELRDVKCETHTWDAAEQQGLEAGSFDALKRTLAEVGIDRTAAILLARRQDLETFHWTAPPAGDDELPELIENYLASDLGLGVDDPVFDYWQLVGQADDSRQIAITAIEQDVAAKYRDVADTLRLRRPRLSVRACGTAALAARLLPGIDAPTLLIVPGDEELDLVIVREGRLGYWRSAYCSPTGDSAAFHRFLTAEVIRTLAVAEENLPEGERVERVAAFLGEEQDDRLLDVLSDAIDLPVARLTPSLPETEPATVHPAGLPGRFAPLLGAALIAAEGDRPAVDLFNRPTPPRSNTKARPRIFLALAAAAAVLLVGYVLHDEVAQVTQDADELAAKLDEIEAGIEQLEPEAAIFAALESWNAGNVVWLDELRDLSLRFPPPGTAVVLDFAASPHSAGGASIRMSGKARDPAVVTALDSALRDQYRSALSRNLREQTVSPSDPFQWRFESSIVTQRRPAPDYRLLLEQLPSSVAGARP